MNAVTEPAGNTHSRTAWPEPGQPCLSSADPLRAAPHGMGLPGIAPWFPPRASSHFWMVTIDPRRPRAQRLSPVDLPRATIRYRAVRGAIERKVVEAHQNDTLGESVVVRFAVDPYHTE